MRKFVVVWLLSWHSQCGNISLTFTVVTFGMFTVPNVSKVIVWGVCGHKMSMENYLVLTWHIQTCRVVFSSSSFVAADTYLRSWTPNSCRSHALVLSATYWQSRCKLLLHFCVNAPIPSQSGSWFPSLSVPTLKKQKHPPFLSHLPPLLFPTVWS